MDADRLDALARLLRPGATRRALVSAIAGGLAPVLPIFVGAGDAARKKRKKKGKKKNKPSVCQPTCGNRVCGADGCGGTCGQCQANESCLNGGCFCSEPCGDKTCGQDGCGNLCGVCSIGMTCLGGACVCDQPCGDNTCGQDGCGNSCGTCATGRICQNGHCVEPCGDTFCAEGERCHSFGQAIGCVTWEGTCPAGANSCAPGPTIRCNGGCICYLSAEGDTRCGEQIIPGQMCGQCTKDADCADFGFGAFCVIAPTSLACCTAGQGFCQLPCSN